MSQRVVTAQFSFTEQYGRNKDNIDPELFTNANLRLQQTIFLHWRLENFSSSDAGSAGPLQY